MERQSCSEIISILQAHDNCWGRDSQISTSYPGKLWITCLSVHSCVWTINQQCAAPHSPSPPPQGYGRKTERQGRERRSSKSNFHDSVQIQRESVSSMAAAQQCFYSILYSLYYIYRNESATEIRGLKKNFRRNSSPEAQELCPIGSGEK